MTATTETPSCTMHSTRCITRKTWAGGGAVPVPPLSDSIIANSSPTAAETNIRPPRTIQTQAITVTDFGLFMPVTVLDYNLPFQERHQTFDIVRADPHGLLAHLDLSDL